MIKSKKLCTLIFAVAFILASIFEGVQASGSTRSYRKVITPKIQLVAQPKAEYNVGERIYIKVKAPNYSGKVEYRAVIWDGNKREMRNLWNTYPYYYKNWQPTGTTLFPITWIASTPGIYRLTVYVRKVGSKVPYESYVETIVFKIKNNMPLTSTYNLTLTSSTTTYGVSDLIDTSFMTQADINSAVEEGIKGIVPVTISLSTKVLGKSGYDYAGIIPLDMPDTQLWAKDERGNWYDMNTDGVGVRERFSLPANYNSSITFYPIFSDKGTYTLTFELVDGYDIDNIIARSVKTFEAKYQRSVYTFFYAAAPSGYTSSALIETEGKTQSEIDAAVSSAIKNITPIYTELFAAQEGIAGYDAARIDALNMEGLQLWIRNADGSWIDANKDGWGPKTGFKLDNKYDKYIDMYPIFAQPGNRTLNVRAIDVSDGKTITGFKATLNVSDKSCYTITVKNSASFKVKDLVDVSDKSQEEINKSVEAAISDISPVDIKLLTKVKGSNGYDSARFAPLGIENMQLWAKNADGNWIDINRSGWGPIDGFQLPSNYEATTRVYPIFMEAGSYKCNIRLVNLSDNRIIAEDMVEIDVR